MNYNRLVGYILTIYLLACQGAGTDSIPTPETDTAKVIELSIRTAFYGYLPDISAVKEKYYFKDSIMFTADPVLLFLVPDQIDTLKFKVLPESKIRSIINADSLADNRPNYLCLRQFEKTDTGYYVQIQSLSGVPYGNGGSVGLYISKENDFFKIKRRIGMSIN